MLRVHFDVTVIRFSSSSVQRLLLALVELGHNEVVIQLAKPLSPNTAQRSTAAAAVTCQPKCARPHTRLGLLLNNCLRAETSRTPDTLLICSDSLPLLLYWATPVDQT